MEDDSARGRNMKGGNEERLHLRPDVQTEVTPEDRETLPGDTSRAPRGGLGAEMLIVVASRH